MGFGFQFIIKSVPNKDKGRYPFNPKLIKQDVGVLTDELFLKIFHSTKKKHIEADNILGLLSSSLLSSSINCVPPHLRTSFTFRSGTVFYVMHLRVFFLYVNQKNDRVQKVRVKYILETRIEIIFAEKLIKKIRIFHETKTIIRPEYFPIFLLETCFLL